MEKNVNIAKKISAEEIIKEIREGKDVSLTRSERKGRIKYITDMQIWQVHANKQARKPKYYVTIEKYDAKWVPEDNNLLLEIYKEFSSLRKLGEFLRKAPEIQHVEWIKDE